MDLRTDPDRETVSNHGLTGIYVRAKSGKNGVWCSFDIAELDRESLDWLLRSRGIDWPVAVALLMLGHDRQ